MGLFRGLFKAGLFLGALAAAAYAAERAFISKLEENPDPDPHWTPQTPDGETARVTSPDGTVLRVLMAGEGPPLVLIHGLLVSLEVWDPVFAEFVKRGHRVIAYDMRGHGGSDVGALGHSLSAGADDLGAVLEQLDLKGAVVVGHSMGGMAALTFALDHPQAAAERVAGLVLANSSAGGLMDVPQNRAQLVMLKMGLAQWFVSHPVHSTLLAAPYFARRPPASRLRALSKMWSAQPPETITGAGLSLEHYDVRNRLGDVATETLVICGTPDDVTPPAHSAELADGVPGAHIEYLEGVGHMIQWMAPDRVVDLVSDFAKERQVAG